MKIAICGRMAAGKTTLANLIINGVNNDVVKLSMAGQVKAIAHELFKMEDKDRPLLQKIGMKMREIRHDVWLDYVIAEADEYDNPQTIRIIDDVRFINEATKLKENGWKIVRISIEEPTQLERLKKTYDNWQIHWNNRDNPSEAEVDKISEEVIDWFVDANHVYDFAEELIYSINEGHYKNG